MLFTITTSRFELTSWKCAVKMFVAKLYYSAMRHPARAHIQSTMWSSDKTLKSCHYSCPFKCTIFSHFDQNDIFDLSGSQPER